MSEEEIAAREGRLQAPEKMKVVLWKSIVERQLGPCRLLAIDEKFRRYPI